LKSKEQTHGCDIEIHTFADPARDYPARSDDFCLGGSPPPGKIARAEMDLGSDYPFCEYYRPDNLFRSRPGRRIIRHELSSTHPHSHLPF
jgi:hypothetical protein